MKKCISVESLSSQIAQHRSWEKYYAIKNHQYVKFIKKWERTQPFHSQDTLANFIDQYNQLSDM